MNSRPIKYLIFFLVCVLSWSLFDSPGTPDVEAWERWTGNAEKHGIVEGYRVNWEDYPPLSSVMLFAFAKTSHWLRIDTFSGLKISLFIFLLLTSLIALAWTKDPFIASMTQLALLLNSVALVYIDIYFTPTLLLAFWALKKRNLFLFTVLYTITCLIKWQPIIIAPFILFYVLKIQKLKDLGHVDWKRILVSAVVPFFVIFAFVYSVYGAELFLALRRATSDFFFSANALNFNWIVTHFLHLFFPGRFGPLVYGHATFIAEMDPKIMLLPQMVFLAFYAFILIDFVRQDKTFKNFLIFSMVGYLAYFAFNTGVHENHLYLASILALVLYWVDRAYLHVAVIIALFANINLFMFYGIDGQGFPFSRVAGVDMALPVSVLYVVFFFTTFFSVIKQRARLAVSSDAGGNLVTEERST